MSPEFWENTAGGRAAELLEKGYKNVEVIEGGVEGWKKAGYALK